MRPGTILAALAALAARATSRPVRLVLSREAVYRTVGGRTRPSRGLRWERTATAG
ncbi:hypothetical protein OG272_20975 [Streptomyces sp. NBC_00104]|uniref:hypothetical protein n=1 Tax=Streptomyces sp. NBC_00104 TaxID=2903621 RepID=UPI0032568991